MLLLSPARQPNTAINGVASGWLDGVAPTSDVVYHAPGTFDARWVIENATPSGVYTRSINILIEGAGAISAIGTSEWSDDGITFVSTSGTITTGKLWVRDTAGAYDAVVNGGVTIDTVTCPMVINSIANPNYALNPDGSYMLNPDGSNVLLNPA